MSRIRFDLDPVPRPRMTRKDKWAKRPIVVAYYDYTEDLRTLAMAEGWEPANALQLTFVLPMPKSWSKKKKREHAGMPHQSKPDLDNLVKGFLDAFGEDKGVWSFAADKRWADQGETGHVEAANVEPLPVRTHGGKP